MSDNTIKITVTLTSDTDPVKLGEAIAHLIQAVTPSEEWEQIAQAMKAQVAEQLARIAEGLGDGRAVIQLVDYDDPDTCPACGHENTFREEVETRVCSICDYEW